MTETPCRGQRENGGEDLWFSPDPGDSDYSEDSKELGSATRKRFSKAVKICRTRCPHVEKCLEMAMDFEDGRGTKFRHGVWGAMLPGERTRLDFERRGNDGEEPSAA